MALKQQQALKQTQRLSPLQMQVIKLVELNTVEVEDRIKQEVEEIRRWRPVIMNCRETLKMKMAKY